MRLNRIIVAVTASVVALAMAGCGRRSHIRGRNSCHGVNRGLYGGGTYDDHCRGGYDRTHDGCR